MEILNKAKLNNIRFLTRVSRLTKDSLILVKTRHLDLQIKTKGFSINLPLKDRKAKWNSAQRETKELSN